MTQLTIIIVDKIHKLPISIVNENLEMSRTHAMSVNMTKSTTPGVHGPTLRPNRVWSKPTHVSVMKAQKEMVNENWVAAIIMSNVTLARLPKIFKAMRE